MLVQRMAKLGLAVAIATAGTWFGLRTEAAAQPVPNEAGAGIQILTRGPVHEAFAATVTFDAQPGLIVADAPPEPIQELPPDQKPEGANVNWIPGYWAWDDDDSDYLWVSGTWRALPPGRQWVPGYWGQTRQGSQWTSGYWADARLTETEYLPEPPESVEAGPSVAATSENQTWIPGNWVWQQNQYLWRPGFWSTVQPNWVWMPAHYVWTPRGYVCVEGYWDHAVARRGVLFAPVLFSQNVYGRQGFSYRPTTVIDLGVFSNHLFLRPNYGHYYFGDYYGANYASSGFSPWFSFYSSRSGYDPFYAHQRWQHRGDRQWDRRVETDFAYRRDNEAARPPRTFAAQRELAGKELSDADKVRVFAQPLEQYTKKTDGAIRFQPVNDDDRKRIVRFEQESRTQRGERQKLEVRAEAANAEQPAAVIKPSRAKLPRSPYVGKEAEAVGETEGLPKVQELPQADPKVVPRQRKPTETIVRPSRRPTPDPRVKPVQTPKVDPKAVPKVDPKDVPRDEPKVVPEAKPVRKPAVEVKPDPRVKPNPSPKVEPKSDPVEKPVRKPEVEKKPEPRVNSIQTRKIETKPGPQVKPIQTRKIEPSSAPEVKPIETRKIETRKIEPSPAPEVKPIETRKIETREIETRKIETRKIEQPPGSEVKRIRKRNLEPKVDSTL